MKSTQTKDDTMHSMTLARLVEKEPWKMWPTPTCADAVQGAILNENTKLVTLRSGNLRKISNNGVSGSIGLSRMVQIWPTASATDYKGAGQNGQLRDRLDYAVERGATKSKVYPTPQSRDYRSGEPNRASIPGKQVNLNDYIKLSFPTPGITGLSNGSGNCEKANQLYEQGVISEEERKSFRAGNGGQLNPDWVEWLMGWGIAWTSLEPMSIEHFQAWKEMVLVGEWWNVDPADIGIIPRITDVKTHRTDRLKAIGNGQVPQTVVLAWTILSQGLEVAK